MRKILPRLAPPLLILALATVLPMCAHRSQPAGKRSAEQRALVMRNAFAFVDEVVPGAVIDLRYATPQNVTGRRLYPADMPCLAHRSTAAKLATVQSLLEAEGFRLKILDAWRPPSSHMALWRSNPDPDYVAPPELGLSLHCYGVAVDVTLARLDGSAVNMPSAFDEFSPRAGYDYAGSDPEIRHNISVLQSAMKTAGFAHIESEWWHYIDPTASGARPVMAGAIDIELPVPQVRLTRR